MNAILKFIGKYTIALVIAALLTALTVLFLGAVNLYFVGTIPVTYTIIATVVTFLLYSFTTCFIAYLY